MIQSVMMMHCPRKKMPVQSLAADVITRCSFMLTAISLRPVEEVEWLIAEFGITDRSFAPGHMGTRMKDVGEPPPPRPPQGSILISCVSPQLRALW